jgi:hypothetical protein
MGAGDVPRKAWKHALTGAFVRVNGSGGSAGNYFGAVVQAIFVHICTFAPRGIVSCEV